MSSIYAQKLTDLHDDKGTVMVQNKVDLREALDAVEISKITGSIINKGKSNEKRVLFQIPQAMWTMDPTLRLALLYRSVGEEGKYIAQLRKWMRDNPRLCTVQERRFY